MTANLTAKKLTILPAARIQEYAQMMRFDGPMRRKNLLLILKMHRLRFMRKQVSFWRNLSHRKRFDADKYRSLKHPLLRT